MRHSTLRLFSAGAIALFVPAFPLGAFSSPSLGAIAQADPAARLAEGDRLHDLSVRQLQRGLQQLQISYVQEALQSLQRALEIYQEPEVRAIFPQESRRGEGSALLSLGIIYTFGNPQRAINYFEQSLTIAREINNHQGERDALHNLGEIHRDLGQYLQIAELFEQYLVIVRDLEDIEGEEYVLRTLGEAYLNLEQYQKAINVFERYLIIAREMNDREREGIILNNLGESYRRLGQPQQSINFYEQGLAIAREMNNPRGEAASLVNLGLAYADISQYSHATQFLEQSLAIARTIDNQDSKKTTIITLKGLGNISFVLGQYSQAIEFYQQSLTIARDLGDREEEQGLLVNLGEVYRNLGRHSQAVSFYEEGLVIAHDLNNQSAKGAALNGLGNVSLDIGQYEQAIRFYRLRLSLARELEDQRGEATALGNLGNASLGIGQYEEALAWYGQSQLIFQELGDQVAELGILENLASTYVLLEQYPRAIDLYKQSLAIARDLDIRSSEASILHNLGATHHFLEQFPSSISALSDAIEVYESLRTADLADINKISLFDTYLKTFLNLQLSLVAQNDIEQALVFAERGRARALIDLLANRTLSNSDPDALALRTVDALALSDIKKVAKEQNATLVQYSVVSSGSLFIWVIQPTGEIAFQEVDLAGQDLSELVSLVRETLGVRSQDRATIIAEITPEEAERRQAQRQQQLQQLHQLLIEPIAQLLPTDPNQRVVIIPHQDLFLVPFPALINAEGQYLIENHTILTAPSIQVLDLTRQQTVANNHSGDRPDNLLIVGNPIMPQVWNPETNQTYQLSSLVGAEDEAIAIAQAFNTEALLWDSATKASVVQQMPSARIIHLATHGLLEYGTPEDSGVLDVPGAIALAPSGGDTGLLTAAEILQMNLGAELVVLSACDTGRGRITGDGVVGLSRAFISAGVPSLIVSLWAVDDAATAELMVTFYEQWEETGDKAQALRQAMLTTMATHPDPRLWAAFTLIGAVE